MLGRFAWLVKCMIEMATEPLDIIYQDQWLVAINKPPGLLVHRSLIDKHVTRFALQEVRNQLGQHVYPVHRLDKPTSGVLVFALSPVAAANIQAQFEQGQVIKEYLLVCRGHTAQSAIIDYPLIPKDDFKKRNKEIRTPKAAQSAITRFERLATLTIDEPVDRYPSGRYSLIKAMPVTGRKHQIRRHFKHISHPLIGCPKYGKSAHNRFFAERLQCNRLLLHCHWMTFVHPEKNDDICIAAQLSGSFAQLINAQNWVWDATGICLTVRDNEWIS